MITSSHRRNTRVATVCHLLCAMVAASPSAQPQTDNVVTLKSGASVEREIAPGAEHAFQVSVAQDEVLRIAVDQKGADVSVALHFGGAAPVVTDDESKHRYGRELTAWKAPARGDVRLVVRAASAPTAKTGRYTLAVIVLSPTETLMRAMAASDDAARLTAGVPVGKAAEAGGQALQAAVDAWRAYGSDRELLAQQQYQLGRFLSRRLQRPVDGVAALKEVLPIYEELALPTELAATLSQLGDSLLLIGNWAQARETYERAATFNDVIDPLNRAIIQDNLARAAQDSGEYDLAISHGQQAIETFRAEGAKRDVAIALERQAQTFRRMRRFDDALRVVTEAIPLQREYGKEDDLATTTMLLGLIQSSAGDDDAALQTFQTALASFKTNIPSRYLTMLSIGRLYNRVDDQRQAREWLEKTLEGVPPQMRDYWAATASELGWTLVNEGDPARALDLQRKALDIVKVGKSPFGELTILRDLAWTYRALKDLDGARTTVARMKEVEPLFPGRPYAALVVREDARNERLAGDLPVARKKLDEALDLVDSERGRVRAQALRASFGGLVGGYYDDAIDLAMQMHAAAPAEGHDARAFELFERSRARSFSDLLSESRSGDIRTGVDPALLAEQSKLQAELGAKDTALRELAGRPNSKERAALLERELDDIVRRLTVVDARIRETSPRYAALTRPNPLKMPGVQALLDDETVLLAFAPSLRRTTAGWAWAVTRDGLRSFPLPPSGRVEEEARKVYAGLAARQRHTAKDGAARLAEIDRNLGVDAAALSDLILGPIADALQNEWRTRRLAIVGTGALEYIPFAALPVPQAAATTAAVDTRPWLVETHELVQLPSASVLARLREDEGTRARGSRPIAVMADAVYGADDPRVQAARARLTTRVKPIPTAAPAPAATAASNASPSPSSSTASASDAPADDQIKTRSQTLLSGIDGSGPRAGFRRLVFSREEATAITRLAAGSRVVEALDFNASVSTMTSPAVADARIVHIASHGILNSARPELSGLVLSLVDEKGHAQEGVVRLYDVFNLKLSADLVVLSGCQTGLGRQMKGEGLVGLTRAFMYAGTPRIVASLWQVDDLATSELMRRFYQGMLVRKLTPAAALRAAQQEMRLSSRWRAPYYWAAFTLMGDWR